MGEEKFESLPQTVTSVRRELVSNVYYFFLDPISLLNFLGTSNLSDNDFTDKQYRVTRAKFVNDRATRLSASFESEILIIFDRAEPSASRSQSTLTRSLPLIKLYSIFISSDNKSNIKQRIIKELNHVISSLSLNINQNISISIVTIQLL